MIIGYANSMFTATHGILARAGGTPPAALLLDTYTGASAAYSLRQLRTAYSGSAIRVRRSSDNAEQDFGFVSNDLDTASLLTFCGVGNGFVTTWYDQSGNANDATQTTAANQPQIVSSGALLTVNSKTCMSFDGSNDSFNLASTITGAASNYQSFVGKRDASARRLYALATGIATAGYQLALWSDNKYYLQAKTTQYQASSATDATTAQLLLTGLNNAGTMSMFKNGSTITSSAVSLSLTLSITAIGFYNNASIMAYCNLQEIVFYNNDQSTNRTGIESDINTFYTIY
jgi:hypothetical protein